ncbi:hypothetical protein CMI41_03360 [Candidatus Pacearchaeota archaeon]|nr:hypothetical protein [Candidatus Pacearchaeota archaeon]|tara:strand:- start:6942 stop:7433 length:492 start_codon:yes stop_codon:yes gene_type:complete
MVKKKVTRKKTTRAKSSGTVTEEKLIKSLIKRDEILVDNFVGLQKAMVNVSVKFNELTDRIDKLLDIYQKAADVFVQKQIREGDRRVELDRKVTNVMQQNKTLARRQVMMQGQRAPLPPTSNSPPAQQAMPTGTPSIASQAPSPVQSPPVEDSSIKPRPLPKF